MSQSHEMEILLADDAAATTNAIAIAARNCNIERTRNFGRDPGKRGTRQRKSCGRRNLGDVITGGFDLYPTATQIDWLMERFFGDNISTYPAAAATVKETLHPIYIWVNKGPTIFRYDLMHFNTLAVTIAEDDYVNFRFDFVGSAETDAGSYPVALPAIDCDSEYIAADSVFNIGGTAYPFKQAVLNFSNQIAPGQKENALVRTIFESEDCVIGSQITAGYRTDTEALYSRAVAGDNSAYYEIDDGTVAYRWTFGNTAIPNGSPTVPDSGEILLPLELVHEGTDALEQVSFSKT